MTLIACITLFFCLPSYVHYFSSSLIFWFFLQLKVFEMLPSLASHSAMIPLVVQTILPMLNKDAKV